MIAKSAILIIAMIIRIFMIVQKDPHSQRTQTKSQCHIIVYGFFGDELGKLSITFPVSSKKSRRGEPDSSTTMLMRAFPFASYKVTLASRSLFLPTKTRVGENSAVCNFFFA